jgi:hypothetical protein
MRPALLSVILATFLAACQLPMKLPDGLESSQRLDISGFSTGLGRQWDRHFLIGSYEIGDIRRSGWTHGRRAHLAFWKRYRQERSYEFAVRAQGRELAASCVASLESGGLFRSKVKSPGLSCTCMEGSTLRTLLELRVSEHERTLRLEADLGAFDLSMWPVAESPRGWYQGGEALGYEVSSERGVGAFELRDGGHAFLPPSLDESERLGAICAYGALMLYEPIESD